MKPSDLNRILFAPTVTSKVLHYLISGTYEVNERGLKFELVYLGLPMIFDEVINADLLRRNRSSSLSTLLSSAQARSNLILLNKRVPAFKEVTNEALIYLGNNIDLDICEYIRASQRIKYQDEKNEELRIYAKSAYNLGLMLSKDEPKSIFLKLDLVTI